MNVSRPKKMKACCMFFVMILAASTVEAANEVVNPYSNPPSGYVFSYDLNQPGPTITCNGSTNNTGMPFQQNTQWNLVDSTGSLQPIASSSIFNLSQEPSPVGGVGQTNLTILNVTNRLDGATITCGIFISAVFQQIAAFPVKIYRVPVLKTIGTVNGLMGSSVTIQIGDTSSPPPYPTPNITITGSGTLVLGQLQYNHPNLMLSGLTETNSGSYVVMAQNWRLNGAFLGASNGTFTLNVQFAPEITAGISQATAVQGQPFPVSLQCGTNLRGNPPPTVQWKSNNGTVVTSGGRYAIDNGPSNVLLNVSNIDWKSNGTWSCNVSNGISPSIVIRIDLVVLVSPSPPPNVTDALLNISKKSQVSVSWQTPYSIGTPPLSVYRVFAVSGRDPVNRTTSQIANQTFAVIDGLRAGLSYNVTVYAVSIVGTTEAVSNPSDMIVLKTDPDVPTVICSTPVASMGSVNVSWVIGYDGGRPVTGIQLGFKQIGSGDDMYQDAQVMVSSDATSAIVKQPFVAASSYGFAVYVTNEVGNSSLSNCGQVTISEGIPPTPKIYSFTYGPRSIVLMLSVASSGQGNTGSFSFVVISTDHNVNQSFSMASYVGGNSRVPINITNLDDGVTYYFNVYATNVYGTSDPANIQIPPKSPSTATPVSMTTPAGSTAVAGQSVNGGAIAGGVLGGIIGLIVVGIIVVIIVLILRQRGASYNVDNKGKGGVKVEEVDVEIENEALPTDKPELHYAELGSFAVKPAAKAQAPPSAKVDEDPVTYSTVQMSQPRTPQEPKPDASSKTDTSTTMV